MLLRTRKTVWLKPNLFEQNNLKWCCKIATLGAQGLIGKLVYQSNLSLYSLYYAKACNELARAISASLRLDNTASFEEMSQRWWAVGNTVSDLTGPRFESQTFHSRDEHVTARLTGRPNWCRCLQIHSANS